jgi:hypothetical protein
MAKIIDWFPKIIFCKIPEIITFGNLSYVDACDNFHELLNACDPRVYILVPQGKD